MKHLTIAMACAATMALAACGGAPEEDTTVADDTAMADQMANADASTGTIAEVAQGNSDLSTLVSAVQSANLGETLSGEGPYTVFAPTNAAFDKVPQETRDQLMSADGQSDLSNILSYHVVEGETMADALTQAIEGAGEEGYTITTLNGGTLTAMMDNGQVILRDAAGNTATVTATDIDASNGVVHTIDTVLMPE